jgi:hypothetical protein
MIVMKNNVPKIVVPSEIDLSAGAELNVLTGEVIRHIARWNPKHPNREFWKGREQSLSRELHLATELDPTQGLSLFDMVLIWPPWLDAKPHFFKDIRGYFNVAASIIARAAGFWEPCKAGEAILTSSQSPKRLAPCRMLSPPLRRKIMSPLYQMPVGRLS